MVLTINPACIRPPVFSGRSAGSSTGFSGGFVVNFCGDKVRLNADWV